jgi:hypothetical protein
VLCGGAGNDTLTGGPGNDVFYGGVGSDTMVIEFNGGDRTPDLEAADQVLFDDSRDPTLAREAPDAKVAWQSAALSVLGADDGGEANLTYSWTVTSLPEGAPAPVFSVNGSNAAKDTVVTFGRAGTYSLSVTIADRGGRQVTDSAEIVVEQMAASMTVTPYHQYLNHRSSAQLYAQVFDQFGNALAAQPSLTWQATAGSINSNGLFTAPSNACTVTIIASTGSVYQTAYVTVTVPTISVGVPFREYYDWLPRLVEGDDDWDEGFDCTVGAQITWDSSQVRANLYMRGREREPDWTTVDGWSGSFQVYAAPAGWRVKSISRSGSDFRSCYFEENRSWQEFSGGNVVQKYKVYGFGFGGNPHTAGSWSQVWVYFNPITVVLEEI